MIAGRNGTVGGWFPLFAEQAFPRDGERMDHAKHMLHCREDVGQSLWQTFNVIQEILIQDALAGAAGPRMGISAVSRPAPSTALTRMSG